MSAPASPQTSNSSAAELRGRWRFAGARLICEPAAATSGPARKHVCRRANGAVHRHRTIGVARGLVPDPPLTPGQQTLAIAKLGIARHGGFTVRGGRGGVLTQVCFAIHATGNYRLYLLPVTAWYTTRTTTAPTT